VLASLSPARRRFVLVVAGLVLVLVGAGVATALAHRDPPVSPVSQDAQPPVLLVPGYGGSRGDLQVLAAALRTAGRAATVVRLAGDGTGDLRTQAAVLDAAADHAMRAANASSVDVVGYSAGGVTARLWVHDLGGGSVARRIVTLGAPQHGTDLAALAGDLAPDRCPVACKQLATNSELLRGLNARDETPSGPVWVSLWTTDDETVVPPDSASLQGALDFSVQSVCPSETVSHGDLPRDPTVIAMTIQELGRSRPVVPSSTICVSP
jgi:triacylglycerol esterase/lipase EstA (alpha/beta hydrolase family)